MSSVTSALIYVEYAEDLAMFETPLPVFSSRPELAEKERFKPIDAETPGGYKYMEVDIFACAFNYCRDEDIIEWYRALPWHRDDVALLLLTPNDGGVTVYPQGILSDINIILPKDNQ